MQKTLTSLAACSAPSAAHTPAGEPVSVIVRASPCPKAPASRCAHLGKLEFVHAEPLVQAPATSQFFVHGTAGGPWKVCPKLLRQKPQKVRSTATLSVVSFETLVDAPVVSLKGIGSVPTKCSESAGGGQSWLVGKPAPRFEVCGVHARPFLGPPWHTLLRHTGQGWMPATSVTRSPVR